MASLVYNGRFRTRDSFEQRMGIHRLNRSGAGGVEEGSIVKAEVVASGYQVATVNSKSARCPEKYGV